jgi:hypothetical protein
MRNLNSEPLEDECLPSFGSDMILDDDDDNDDDDGCCC